MSARMSLLEMVVDILSDMDSDEVNSIDDTQESAQVAQIIKSTYFAMLSNRNWPHMRKTISFTPYGATKPTHLLIPENVKEVVFVKYNTIKTGDTRKLYTDMKWKEPDDFLRLNNQLDSSAANVLIVEDLSGVELLVRNDVAPQYYTSFDDKYVVFDSYDSVADSTLQESKIQAMGYVYPEWTVEDSFIPDLPIEAFTALLEEAKSRASMKLKQVADQKAEQESVRQSRWLSRKAWVAHGGIKYPSYGRTSRK